MAELSHKYLQLADLRRLRNLLFASRRPVHGRYAGRHVSPQRGHSVEFADYRQYIPGDELGDVDWKVYGRSDKLFVRLFEHQSDMTVHLLVDASASMGYSGAQGSVTRALGPDSKYDHACRIAAAIAFLTTRQQDRVSFAVAREGLAEFVRPHGSPSHLLGILQSMERIGPGGAAQLAVAITELASRVPKRGVLVILSDLLDEAGEVLKAMSLFSHQGGDVVVFHVLHAEELRLPAIGDAVFTDSETGQRIALAVPDVREAYEQRMRHFLDGWSAACRDRGFEYQLVNTAVPCHKVLESFLFTRAGAA